MPQRPLLAWTPPFMQMIYTTMSFTADIVDELVTVMEKDCNTVVGWVSRNHLELNKKTVASRKERKGIGLCRSNNEWWTGMSQMAKCLGVWIDNGLTWREGASWNIEEKVPYSITMQAKEAMECALTLLEDVVWCNGVISPCSYLGGMLKKTTAKCGENSDL